MAPFFSRHSSAPALVLIASGALGLCSTAALADGDRRDQLERLLDAQQARAKEVDAELAGLGGDREALQRELRSHAGALYRLQRGGLLPLAGGLEALLGHAANLDRLQRVVLKDLAATDALQDRGRALRAETAELEIKVESTRVALAKAKEARQEDMLEDRADAEFEQAFEVSRARLGQTIRTREGTLSVLDEGFSRASFEQARGNLALPISGPSEVREAFREESDGSGLELMARAGTPARACAPGRVAFAETYGSYGRIVILDHGERFYSVYAGLGAIEVRVGDDVSRSARLGQVGMEGALYFEVRKGTRNLPTRAWLGI